MATLTSKGQVTIPKKWRDRLGLKPGSKVTFDEREDGAVVICRADIETRGDAKTRIAAVTGIVQLEMPTDVYMKLLRGDEP